MVGIYILLVVILCILVPWLVYAVLGLVGAVIAWACMMWAIDALIKHFTDDRSPKI